MYSALYGDGFLILSEDSFIYNICFLAFLSVLKWVFGQVCVPMIITIGVRLSVVFSAVCFSVYVLIDFVTCVCPYD